MKDGWILIDPNGVECGRGTGPTGPVPDGVTVVWLDTRADVDDHPMVVDKREREAAENTLTQQQVADRAQAFALKTICARAFLREVIEVPGMESLADCIDPDLYPDLYTEYWRTYLQTPWTPHELARKIVARAEAVMISEAALREQRLNAEHRLMRVRPTLDEV